MDEQAFAQEAEETREGTVTGRYVTGPAGTGKTEQARQRIKDDPEEGVLCATTGVAAINLNTTTINSLFGYFDTDDLADKYANNQLTRRYIQLRKHDGYRSVIIDEASMLDADALNYHVLAAKGANARMDPDTQISLELTGDFAQLPPIKGRWAFKSPLWDEIFAPNVTKLTKVWRQTDLTFLDALAQARLGNGKEASEMLRPLAKWTSALDLAYPGVTIVAKNDEVERINTMRYLKLPGTEQVYWANAWGAQKGEWKPLNGGARLKEGALVMILTNGYDDFTDEEKREYAQTGRSSRRRNLLYANGDVGNVTGMSEAGVWVTLKRNGAEYLVPRVTRTVEVKEEPDERKRHANVYFDEKRKRWITGSITYMPLRLGYAITVHKSQGLTMDHVQLDPRAGFFGSPNMAYVALSRIRTPQNLKIVGTPEMLARRINVDKEVGEWL